MNVTFESWWTSRFDRLPPLGHELRCELPYRWLRIHSLPGSKRYADSKAEYQEILRRQRAIAIEILRNDAAPFVSVPVYFETTDEAPVSQDFAEFPGVRFGRSMEIAEGEWHGPCVIYAARAPLSTPALRAIADDELRAVWASTETEEIFAPYDGGVDVIVQSPTRVAELRAKFRDWLPPRADGL